MFENNNTPATTATRQPRTDYTKLIHNGRTYENLEMMVTQIAKERSNVAFKSTKLILNQLEIKVEDQVLADAMIRANALMIHEYIKEKADSRGLFGL